MLLRGLSPHSATITRVSAGQTFGRRRRERENVTTVEGPKAAQRAFESIFAGRKKKPATT